MATPSRGRSTVWPSISTCPELGANRPPMHLSKVVLPQPEGPTTQRTSRFFICRSTLRKATTDPSRKSLLAWSITIFTPSGISLKWYRRTPNKASEDCQAEEKNRGLKMEGRGARFSILYLPSFSDHTGLFRFRDLDFADAFDGVRQHFCVLVPELLEFRSIEISDRRLEFFHC